MTLGERGVMANMSHDLNNVFLSSVSGQYVKDFMSNPIPSNSLDPRTIDLRKQV